MISIALSIFVASPLDPALSREVIRDEIPADQLVYPADSSKLVEIGVEVSEQLGIILQQIRVIRRERVQYACEICDHGLKVASVPPRYRIAVPLRRRHLSQHDSDQRDPGWSGGAAGDQPDVRDVLLDSGVTQGD
ncbi:MAG: IS66 family transposase zinc-finger binding domain-containing protein [Burkholderia sp.]